VVGAELVRMADRIGRVAEGYLADLIAVDGNPLDDISVLERPERALQLVIKGGTVFKNRLA
jgi:imidazolonepropionase-like amidohydrolase